MVLSDEQMIFHKKWRSQRVATSTEGLSTLRQYRICQLQDDFLRIGSQILTKQPQNGDFPPCSSRKKKRPETAHRRTLAPHFGGVWGHPCWSNRHFGGAGRTCWLNTPNQRGVGGSGLRTVKSIGICRDRGRTNPKTLSINNGSLSTAKKTGTVEVRLGISDFLAEEWNIILVFSGCWLVIDFWWYWSIETANWLSQWLTFSNFWGDDEYLGGGFKDFYFHPYLGKWSNLTSLFFKCVGSTTN